MSFESCFHLSFRNSLRPNLSIFFCFGLLFLIFSTGKTEGASNIEELTDAIGKRDLLKLHRTIASGVDVNAPNPMMYGLSPFSYAIQEQNIPIIETLLKEGHADPNQEGLLEVPVLVAIQTRNLKIVELLVRYGAQVDKQGPLHLASETGQGEVVDFLLKHGAKINAQDSKGSTPLHKAVMNQHSKVVSFLLEKGSNPDLKDINGKTPLDYARLLRHQEIVSLLIPITQSAPNDDWHIEFAEAASAGLLEEVKRFLDDGVTPNAHGWDKNYPIHIATGNGHSALVTLLIDSGADINARGENGSSPLHHAVEVNRASIVQLLLEKGSDPLLRDADGQTPLDIARKKREQYLARDLGIYRDDILIANDQIINILSNQSSPAPQKMVNDPATMEP